MPRVLIVEDEVLIGFNLREELQDVGFVAVIHTDAESALKAFESETFEAAIIDVGLPGMSGIELLNRIRARRSHFPVLLATGVDTAIFQAQFANDRHACILPKPYETSALLGCLRNLGFDLEPRNDPRRT